MHERYTDKEVAEIWSEENKFKIWFDIEHAVCEINGKLGHIPSSVSKYMQLKKDECLHEGFVEKICVMIKFFISSLKWIKQIAKMFFFTNLVDFQ